jgi:hypothetical protein
LANLINNTLFSVIINNNDVITMKDFENNFKKSKEGSKEDKIM